MEFEEPPRGIVSTIAVIEIGDYVFWKEGQDTLYRVVEYEWEWDDDDEEAVSGEVTVETLDGSEKTIKASTIHSQLQNPYLGSLLIDQSVIQHAVAQLSEAPIPEDIEEPADEVLELTHETYVEEAAERIFEARQAQ